MKVLAQRLWNEPVLAAAFLYAVAMTLGELLIGDGLQIEDLAAILGPIAPAVAARQAVTPVRKR